MSTLSYAHQLFSPEQCQAYIHALRWNDRPSTVPGARAKTFVLGACTTIGLG